MNDHKAIERAIRQYIAKQLFSLTLWAIVFGTIGWHFLSLNNSLSLPNLGKNKQEPCDTMTIVDTTYQFIYDENIEYQRSNKPITTEEIIDTFIIKKQTYKDTLIAKNPELRRKGRSHYFWYGYGYAVNYDTIYLHKTDVKFLQELILKRRKEKAIRVKLDEKKH